MTRWILTALLGLALVLSLSLSAAQAAAMSVDMSLGMAGSHDCGGCTGGADKDGVKTAACVQFCVPALAAILPMELIVAETDAAPQIAGGAGLDFGVTRAPIPAPPRF
jgi:hypothetical protein